MATTNYIFNNSLWPLMKKSKELMRIEYLKNENICLQPPMRSTFIISITTKIGTFKKYRICLKKLSTYISLIWNKKTHQQSLSLLRIDQNRAILFFNASKTNLNFNLRFL